MVVAVIVGGSYPYVVLKIGYGPNISVVSAFFGYLALAAIAFFTGIRGTRWENNLVQTAGTAAGEAASLHFPVWLTLVSLDLSVALMLVGTRVLGETN